MAMASSGTPGVPRDFLQKIEYLEAQVKLLSKKAKCPQHISTNNIQFITHHGDSNVSFSENISHT